MEHIHFFSREPFGKVRPRPGRRLITIPLLRRDCHYRRDYHYCQQYYTTTDTVMVVTIVSTITITTVVATVVITITAAIPQPASPADNEKVARGSYHGVQAKAASCSAIALSTTWRQKHIDAGLAGRLPRSYKIVVESCIHTRAQTTCIINLVYRTHTVVRSRWRIREG